MQIKSQIESYKNCCAGMHFVGMEKVTKKQEPGRDFAIQRKLETTWCKNSFIPLEASN